MKLPPGIKALGYSLALGALAPVGVNNLMAEEFEAVSSRVSPEYVREKLQDGSFKAESYAFAKGGYWSGPLADKAIDRMDFMEVARTMAVPLKKEGYISATDPKTTKLLIMVYWGTTFAPEHESDSPTYQHLADANSVMGRRPNSQQTEISGKAKDLEGDPDFDAVTVAIAAVQAENRMRDLTNRRNAMMLGYDSWWEAVFDAPNGSALEMRKRDMLDELESNRYFVVLMAYDFQLLWKERKHRLLWETRFSIDEHHNAFDKQLAAMALDASKYFGRDSKGLTHELLPEGHVDIGKVRNLGAVPAK
jgi:hypothetical protein